MAPKCSVELRIADVIHSHGRPMNLSHIASSIHSNLPGYHPLSHAHHEIHSGDAFNKANGCDMWKFASENQEFNKLFNDGTTTMSRMASRSIISGYRDGFQGIKSLVDVGGGTRVMTAEIVKSYPHIKGINFDLPHVIATTQSFNSFEDS
ncbi:hypothetical protein ACOSQ4_031213 [Xanthoceras sorbifolium]